MINKNIKPIFSCSFSIKGEIVTFFCFTKEVRLRVDPGLLECLQYLCDGFNDLKFIANECSIFNKKEVEKLLSTLLDYGILVDSNFLLLHYLEVEKNPQLFGNKLNGKELIEYSKEVKKRHETDSNFGERYVSTSNSSLSKSIEDRTSIRDFASIPVTQDSIINILWDTYGTIHQVVSDSSEINISWRKTVPSAGGLYPLSIYLGMRIDCGSIKKGIYLVHFEKEKNVFFEEINGFHEEIEKSFMDPSVTWGSAGTLIIAGSFVLSANKYGSRAIRYVTLEAGHAAQNFHLSATIEGIQTLEIGGFYDDMLKKACRMDANFSPIISIVFGVKNDNPKNGILEDIEIDWIPPFAGDYQSDLYVAVARLRNEKDGLWSTGRSFDSERALTKAVSEVKEWNASSNVINTVKANYLSLSNAIHPRNMVDYNKQQISSKKFPFLSFDDKREYVWTQGHKLHSQEEVSILADFVFFPFSHKFQYFYGNTSGTAAHPEKDVAIRKAVLELVERDAFMIHHLVPSRVKKILKESLPEFILERVTKLKKVGFEVGFYDYTLDLSPVVFCHVLSDKYHFSTCSACSDFDIVAALDHALMESETSVLHRLRFNYNKVIKPNQVVSPEDHALLYSQKRFYKKSKPNISHEIQLDSLVHNNNSVKNWEKLMNCLYEKGYEIIISELEVNQKFGGNKDLHIVRAMIPGLVPLTFGYNLEPYGLKRIYELGSKLTGDTITFEQLNKLPHPYN